LIIIGKTLKQLIEDYVKPKHIIVQNWRELEKFSEVPLKEFCVGIYKKIYLFVQLMQTYLSEYFFYIDFVSICNYYNIVIITN
jgi:hypothetical protein